MTSCFAIRIFVLITATAVSLADHSFAAEAPSAEKEKDKDGLEVHGLVNQQEGDRFRVWISIENRSSLPAQNLVFKDFSTPGFDPIAGSGNADVLKPKGRPASLGPGKLGLYWEDLERNFRAGDHPMSGILTWEEGEGGPTRQATVVIPADKSWFKWQKTLDLFKDLLWPVAALGLGLLFQRGAERRAAHQQTWAQMLATSQKYAERHYMPIGGTIDNLRASLARNHRDQARYFLALFWFHMVSLRQQVGGFYFKDRNGEGLAVRIWNFLNVRTKRVLGELQIDSLLALLPSSKTTFSAFENNLAGAPLNPGHDHLEPAAWLTSSHFKEFELHLFSALKVVIDFEMNRPYEQWYGRQERLECAALEGIETKLLAAARLEETRPANRALPEVPFDPAKLRALVKNIAMYRRRHERFGGLVYRWGARSIRWAV